VAKIFNVCNTNTNLDSIVIVTKLKHRPKPNCNSYIVCVPKLGILEITEILTADMSAAMYNARSIAIVS